MEIQETQHSQNNFERENQKKEFTLPNFKTYYNATIIKPTYIGTRADI
jgi:hypothetical protein